MSKRKSTRSRPARPKPEPPARTLDKPDDPAFLNFSELIELSIDFNVLMDRLAHYGLGDERAIKEVADARITIDSAIGGEIDSCINCEAQVAFEDWEKARGTLGKAKRNGPDAIDLAIEEAQRACGATPATAEGGDHVH